MLPAKVTLPFTANFGLGTDTVPKVLEEVWVNKSGVEDSADPVWWVNSGARMITALGRGNTIQGPLDPNDPWFADYAKNSETDFGKFPQSIFRLYTRQMFLNTSCSVIYRQNDYHLSPDEHRAASNGLLVMSRAQRDGQNSYYGGVRVDGTWVIKRKKAGVYTTLAGAEKAGGKIYPGTYSRDVEGHQNLLPLGHWIGIKLTTQTLPDNTVKLTLYRDAEWSGIWSKIGSVVDTSPILAEGLHCLRTDFADVTFDGFKIEAA